MKKIAVIIAPIIAGTVFIAALYFLKITSIHLLRLDFVLNAIISCAATFSGFILTAVSILIGFSSSKIMQAIKDNGGMRELSLRYTEALILGLLIIVFSIILGGVVDETNIISEKWFFCGAGLLVAYVVSIITTGYYLLRIIAKIPSKPGITSDQTPSTPSGDFR